MSKHYQEIFSKQFFHIAGALFVWILMLARVFYFYHAPDAMKVTAIPDDTFYYVQLAQHHIQDGGWHFDNHTSTTGFHLFYAYFLVFLLTTFKTMSWPELFLIVSLFSTTALAAATYFSLRSSEILFGFQASLWSLLPYLTVSVFIQSSMMMESWLVIFFTSLGFYYVLSNQKLTLPHQAILILVGFFGSLSRSDFGLFPGLLCVVFLLSAKHWQHSEVKRSSLWFLGAILGLCVVSIHAYMISGHATQSSAQTKLYWSSLIGHDIQIPWQFMKSIIIPQGNDLNLSNHFWKIFFLVIFSCLELAWASIKENRNTYFVAIAALLTLCGYTVIYRYNSSALQVWYVANYVVPICIIAAALGSLISKSIERIPPFKKLSLIPFIYALSIYLPVTLKHIFYMPWVHQSGMMYAGLNLKDMKTNATFAAWNAGIISYFSGLNIVNLDGLVNDKILAYIKKGQLIDYIREENIPYIVDYEFMLDNPTHNKRGGYGDGKLRRCLVPIKAIDGPAPEWPPSAEHSKLKLFAVKSECLSSQANRG